MKDHDPPALCLTGKSGSENAMRIAGAIQPELGVRSEAARLANAPFTGLRINNFPERRARSGEYPHHRTVNTAVCFSLALEKFSSKAFLP